MAEEDSYQDAPGLEKHSRDTRRDRSGRTYRGYQQGSKTKREHTIIEGFQDADAEETGASFSHLSLDKDKRWAVLDQLKKDDRYTIVEKEKMDIRQERLRKERKAESVRQQRERHEESGSSEDGEKKMKEEYRFTKGGPKGVMISKRRKPGKKGVTKTEEKASESSESESESGSDDVEESSGYVIVERNRLQVKHDTRRKGNSWCNCEMCNPVQRHYDRVAHKREVRDAILHQ